MCRLGSPRSNDALRCARAAGWSRLALVSPWLVASAFALLKLTAAHGLIFAGLAATALASTLFLLKWAEERRWARPIRLLAARMKEHGEDSGVDSRS